jgi:hypothetical protein
LTTLPMYKYDDRQSLPLPLISTIRHHNIQIQTVLGVLRGRLVLDSQTPITPDGRIDNPEIMIDRLRRTEAEIASRWLSEGYGVEDGAVGEREMLADDSAVGCMDCDERRGR